MTGRFIFDRHAAFWREDGRCEFYICDVSQIDRLRIADLAAIGLPAEDAMLSLWQTAQRICSRADQTGVPELLEAPYLLWIDGRSGQVLERWEAQDEWHNLLARLKAVA